MRTWKTTITALGLIPTMMLAAHCGTNQDKSVFNSGNGGSGGDDSGVFGGSGGIGGGGGKPIELDANPGDSQQQGDGNACSADEAKADRIPLDVVILLDVSGSMSLTDSTNKAKYDAVKEALTAFLNDPKSSDLQVGLQYLPLNKPGVPDTCTNKASCGAGGPCTTGVCLDSIFPNGTSTSTPVEQWQACDKKSDCGPQGCVTLGESYDGSSLCILDPANFSCFPLPSQFCLNALSCDANQYAQLDVKVASMATAGPAIIQSMGAHKPNGTTPTYPALSGAIEAAKADLTAQPTHTAIVLFATDGLPTACSPLDIASVAGVAKSAAAGTPPIRTFVIGIFTNQDMVDVNGNPVDPQSNLDQIAAAGGTTNATIIKASSTDVAKQFLAELEKIRGSALACEYNIPTPAPPKTLDYGKVNVQYQSGSNPSTTLTYVGSVDKCGADGGWYYDKDPAKGETPTKIKLCDSTCKTVQADSQAKVSFALGCKSKGPA